MPGLQYRETIAIDSGGYPGEGVGSNGHTNWTDAAMSGTSSVSYYYHDSDYANDSNSSKVTVVITTTWTAVQNNDNSIDVTFSSVIDSLSRGDIRGNPGTVGRTITIYNKPGGSVVWGPQSTAVQTPATYISTDVPIATQTVHIAPQSEANLASLYYLNVMHGYEGRPLPNIGTDAMRMGVFFRNTLPPDYRPGKTWNGSEWLSHNRGAGSYVSSKNLFDKNHLNSLNAYLSSNNTIVGPSNNDRVWWMECEPNTTYVVQRAENATQSANRFKLATTTATPALGTATSGLVYLGDGTHGTVLAITTNSTAKYLCMQLYNTTGASTESDVLSTVMVEKRGTNLFNLYSQYPVGYSVTRNGVTFTWLGDERWKIQGTATAQIDTVFYGGWGSTIDPAGFLGDNWRGQVFSSHAYKDDGTSADNTIEGHVWFFKNGASYWTRWGSSWTAPTDTGVNGIEVFITVPNGRTVNETLHFQVERGATTPWVPYASPYEPYTTQYFSAGATDIYTSATSKNTMRTQDGASGSNNPPQIYHTPGVKLNMRKIGEHA